MRHESPTNDLHTSGGLDVTMSDEKVIKKQMDFSVPLMATLFVFITLALYGLWMILTSVDVNTILACAFVSAIIAGFLSFILTMTVTK